ncbi:peptidase S53 domain-containing protein [Favolaschia claudopus]|uniref:tripeptidyl-peptidase II n=1 Tax=Favolaschia claudopus TaxID=2862362 RepID=A0AAW0AVX0_9AGAR
MVRLVSQFIALAALVCAALAKPMSERAMAVYDRRPAPARGFVNSGAPSAGKQLTLRLALKQNNIAGLEKRLYAVSDPASVEYGHHLSADEVAEFVKPTSDTLSSVTAWLTEHDLSAKPVSHAGDILEITLPVAKANSLLATEFSVFTHLDSGKTSIRTLSYSLPVDLQAHIDNITPTTSFLPPVVGPQFAAVDSSPQKRQACGLVNNPACINGLYDINTKRKANQSTNILGVAGFIDQYANEADLKQFLASQRPDIDPSTTFTLQTLYDGSNPQDPSLSGIEANLDIQYTIGIATGVPVTFISVGPDAPDGLSGFLDIINTLISEPSDTRPNVLSTSYAFDEQDLPQSLATTLCNAYLQLGAMGTSVIFSSGDLGVGGTRGLTCTRFLPTLPSNCPWVTSVGAVNGYGDQAASYSGGGFSNYFPTPDYQASDVAAFLQMLGDQYSGLYNSTGRAFPDVSATGNNFEIVWQGQVVQVSGTSASAPVFASMIALLNDELIGHGRPPLGFLNPFLYNATVRSFGIADVRFGSNPGCGTAGFTAGTGWDPVTGVGNPKFYGLRGALGLCDPLSCSFE